MPVRIYDISKKLGLEHKVILAKAKQLGITAAKVSSSSLDKISAEWLEEELIKAHPEVAARLAPKALEEKIKDLPIVEKPIIRISMPEPVKVKPLQVGKVTTTRRLVVPLRNREENFFEISPWFLANDILVQQISDEDFATLHREETEIFRSIVTANSQCLIVNLSNSNAEQTAYEAAAKVQFAFKTFSNTPLILSHAAVILAPQSQKASVEKSLALPVWGDYGQFLSAPFAFVQAAHPEKVTQFFKILSVAIEKHPGLLITLSRFNSCWLRSTDHDRVIDVAISLESLLSSVTEIKFKFALFNSFITFSSPEEREKAFELLQLLYDARSSIVHGDSKGSANRKKIEMVLTHIGEIFQIAQAAISYYIFFLYCRDPKDWQSHIERLVFGTEKRLNQEETNENQIAPKKT